MARRHRGEADRRLAASAGQRRGAAMSVADRRTVLRLATGALLLPLASAVAAHPASPLSRFSPPDGPMLYSRRLERMLVDGAIFSVVRRFEVRFEHRAGGYQVDGRQIDVEVEAPEQLAAFARIEREREERGLFPLLLDEGGTIAGGAGKPFATRLDAAVREAFAVLEARP